MFNLVKLEPDRLDIEGVVTNDVTTSQVENQVPDCALLPFQRAVTPANETFIRRQLDKQEVTPDRCSQKTSIFTTFIVVRDPQEGT